MENDKSKQYQKAYSELKNFLDLYNDGNYLGLTAKLTTLVSAVKNNIKDLNFVGFYMVTKKDSGNNILELHDGCILEVGVYQSDILATPLIEYGKGVVGSCWKEAKTLIVSDVSQCKNYIACDDVTKSEICLPLYENGKIVGVFDVDSTLLDNFDFKDEENFTKLMNLCSS